MRTKKKRAPFPATDNVGLSPYSFFEISLTFDTIVLGSIQVFFFSERFFYDIIYEKKKSCAFFAGREEKWVKVSHPLSCVCIPVIEEERRRAMFHDLRQMLTSVKGLAFQVISLSLSLSSLQLLWTSSTSFSIWLTWHLIFWRKEEDEVHARTYMDGAYRSVSFCRDTVVIAAAQWNR